MPRPGPATVAYERMMAGYARRARADAGPHATAAVLQESLRLQSSIVDLSNVLCFALDAACCFASDGAWCNPQNVLPCLPCVWSAQLATAVLNPDTLTTEQHTALLHEVSDKLERWRAERRA